MFLKRIDFENFKSFAGKLSIPFMEGYTAITGPNGSGKSNIIDGMMFVMGPKSSKVLRAKKLTDMIYKGDKGSVKATYTKVTLVFDNSDRMLSVDADEVRFMRHVKLGSSDDKYYSKFYINDNPSSAEEFDSILTRVRISADGYNMVQQGDVAYITTISNLERRRIIDGISGIASYDADLQKAMAKKEETLNNIDTASVLFNEIKTQLHKLEKEKEQAQKYQDTKKRLDMSYAQMKHKSLEIEQGKLEMARQNVKKIEKTIEELKAKRDKAIKDIEDLGNKYIEIENEIAAKMGPEYVKTKEKIDELVLQKGIADDRISTLKEENEELKQKIADDNVTLEAKKAELATSTATFNEKTSLLNEKKEEQKAVRDEIKVINDEMNNAGGETKKLNKELSAIEKNIDKKDAEYNEVNTEFANAKAQEDSATNDVSRVESDIENADLEVKDAKWNLDEFKKDVGPVANIEGIRLRITEIQKEENKLIDDRKDIKSAVDRLTSEYNRLYTEKKANDIASGNDAVHMVMQMRDTGALKGIYGTISELASVDPEYETAIAVAAGGKAFSIVVENDQVASTCIEALKKAKAGRATFLPLNKVREGKPRAAAILAVPKTIGYAIDLIKFDRKFYAAFWTVLGDTLVVNNMDEGRRLMGGIRMVTKEGELFDASGAMTGGQSKNAIKLKFGAGSQGKLDEVTLELQKANAALEEIDNKISKLEEESRQLGFQITNGGAANIEVQQKLAKYESDYENSKKNRSKLDGTLKEKKEALGSAKVKRDAAEEKFTKVSAELEKLKQERENIRTRLQQIAPAEINQRMSDARKKDDELGKEIEVINNEILWVKGVKFQTSTECDNLTKLINDNKASIAENEKEITNKSKEVEVVNKDLTALRKISNDMESKVKELRDKKEKVGNDKIKAENAKETAMSNLDTQNGLIDDTRANIITYTSQVERIREEIKTIEFEVELPLPSEDELNRRIKSDEETLKKIGNVNLLAITDYDEKKARFDEVSGQLKELNDEIEKLEKFMVETNGKKKDLFMAKYEAIAKSFMEIFKEISGGGEGHISLENMEDPFLGGLILNARPKSGKMLSLASLSGGEKSLTALAFIFAIQDCLPSPFYVFDEVDMFLDPINAEIVAAYIKKSSASTQFLQITHKPNVLPISNHLVGVTKQANGISRVIMEPNIDDLIKQDPDMQKEMA